MDNLGSRLRQTLSNITRSIFIDKKLINELIKDIQRALLAADVNVKLVFDLTEKIKNRALDEKEPKGVDKRTYIINIVYEELVNLLGKEEKGIKVERKKPFKIMMVGLFGSGKCVHPESKIQLSNGNIIEAQNLYELHEENQEKQKLEDGEVIDISKQNLLVPSFNQNTLKIENKRATHLWKLKGKELLQVYLDNGNDFSVRVTPEHPFFVLREGRVQKVRADQLNEDDAIAVPFNYTIHGENQDLFKELKKLDIDVMDYKLDTSKVNIKDKIIPALKFRRNYCQLTADLKKGITPLCLIDAYAEDSIKIRLRGSEKFISFPTYLNKELAEFLGYVIGDGHLGKNYVEISNEDQEIINRVNYLSNKLFNIKVNTKVDLRTKNTRHLIMSSKTLVEILNKIFKIPIGKKGKHLRVPLHILKADKIIVENFLRAYFDCDASATNNTRGIELCSESRQIISDVAYLLNRFSIISSISKKYINEIPYWRLCIRARYAECYASQISFSVKHKRERVEEYSIIGRLQGCGKQDMIPLGHSLHELRESLGFSIGEIQEYVTSYGIYEEKGEISRESLAGVVALYLLKKKGNFFIILDNINKNENILSNAFINGFLPILRKKELIKEDNGQLILTEKAVMYKEGLGYKQYILDLFKILVKSDVCWLRIKKIENIASPEYVYDLTVEDNHSFIADNIIVHNTTSIGKLSKYYSKRGYKVATLGLDVHRPAAPDQLKQLCDSIKIDCFIDKKEKDPLKIWKTYEDEYKNYDMLIIDTAGRAALSEDLLEEIRILYDKIKPDENLLVMSADIGQAAQKQAEAFNKNVSISGVIVTKMDGTAKAGGSLSACNAVKAPIKFLGVGEKVDDLELYDPEGFVSRLLGMGDLKALLEKDKDVITEEEAKDISEKFVKGEFNLIDLYHQMEAMSKMGPLGKVMEMIPGLGSLEMPKDLLKVQEGKLKKWKHVIDSCRKEELENPDIIERSRIERIAKGSGTTSKEVRELLKQYRLGKKVMKTVGGKAMKTKDINKLVKQFKGKMPKGLGI